MSALVSTIRAIAVDLHGYGQIGRALIPRLEQAGIPLASIHDSRGVRASVPVHDARGVFVDATAPRYDGVAAAAWIQRLEKVLESGASVVTCNKAPLALEWRRLVRAAERGGSVLALSGTVGGGTPVLRYLRRLHCAYGVVRVEAGLSGTLSFVLDRVGHRSSLEAAVQQAQRAGFAEPDPRLDLDGTDAYAKSVIIHNHLYPTEAPISIADRKAKLDLHDEGLRQILSRGLLPQVIATIEPGSVDVRLEGRRREEVFAAAPGNVVVAARVRDGKTYHLTGPGAGAAVTAATIVGDLESVRERGHEAGWGLLP